MFYQPVNRIHRPDADHRHHERVRADERHGGHDRAAEQRDPRLLFPAVDAIAAGDRAPDARSPEKILVERTELFEQVIRHSWTICRNLARLRAPLAGNLLF